MILPIIALPELQCADE